MLIASSDLQDTGDPFVFGSSLRIRLSRGILLTFDAGVVGYINETLAEVLRAID
jgi:hypothetical protein